MRIPLNPCDYHFFVLQRDARRAEICRFIPYLGIDLAGRIEAEGIRRGIAVALRRDPAVAGGLDFSPLLARPHWQVGDLKDPTRNYAVVGQVYQYHDLRASANWPDDADRLVDQVCSGGRNVREGPVWRLHHVEGPTATRVFLTWPHMLMDAQGAYDVLRLIGFESHADQGPAAISKQATDPLAVEPWLNRGRRLRAGLRLQRETSRTQTVPPPTGSIDPAMAVRYERRFGLAEDFARLSAAAKRLSPLGPALYARHLASCTLRALKRLYDRHGWSSPNYAISFPMQPRMPFNDRSLHGNYIVSAMIRVESETIADWRRLGETIQTQIAAFREGGDLDQWAMLWASGLMRPGQYHWMMKSSVAKTPIQSGFSYFEAGHSADDGEPRKEFLGRSILRAHCGGVAAVPPGWNPVFWRYGDQISMTLAWPRGYLDDALSVEYADLIESEALSPSD